MDSTRIKRAAAAAVPAIAPSSVVGTFPAPRQPSKFSPLPFYPEAELVPCEGGAGLAIHWREYRCTLNYTNDPLYWLNDQGALRLTRATVLPYVRFFLSQVRGFTGCFDLVEPDDAINWLPAINPGHKERVRNHLQPMRYHGIDAGRHLVSATVIFSNYESASLFRVDIRIAPRPMSVLDIESESLCDLSKGQIQIYEDAVLVRDLGIVIPTPPAR